MTLLARYWVPLPKRRGCLVYENHQWREVDTNGDERYPPAGADVIPTSIRVCDCGAWKVQKR